MCKHLFLVVSAMWECKQLDLEKVPEALALSKDCVVPAKCLYNGLLDTSQVVKHIIRVKVMELDS
jgi:hypothetical protein